MWISSYLSCHYLSNKRYKDLPPPIFQKPGRETCFYFYLALSIMFSAKAPWGPSFRRIPALYKTSLLLLLSVVVTCCWTCVLYLVGLFCICHTASRFSDWQILFILFVCLSWFCSVCAIQHKYPPFFVSLQLPTCVFLFIELNYQFLHWL